MRTSAAGVRMIAGFEGFIGHPYNDATGNATIGIGHLLHLGPVTAQDWALGTITRAQGEQLLARDLARYEHAVNAAVHVRLSQPQFDALVSLAYNIGTGAFESSTLVRLLNRGDYRGAQAQFLLWDRSRGSVLEGLVRRRRQEAALFGSKPPPDRRIRKWQLELRRVRARAARVGWTLYLRRRGRQLKRDIARAEGRA